MSHVSDEGIRTCAGSPNATSVLRRPLQFLDRQHNSSFQNRAAADGRIKSRIHLDTISSGFFKIVYNFHLEQHDYVSFSTVQLSVVRSLKEGALKDEVLLLKAEKRSPTAAVNLHAQHLS